jgi:hypothetical protein
VPTHASADAGSVRNAIRWGLLLASIGTVGFRLPRLVNEFRQWRDALRVGDSSGAEGWHTILTVELVGSLVVLVIGVGAFYFLRPKSKTAS